MPTNTTITTFVFLTVLLVLAPTAWAADLHITVKQKGSGIPIEGATVVLGQSNKYLQTDATGTVLFKNTEKPETIKILAPGYETLTRKLPADKNPVTVYLTPTVVEGEGITVTADRLMEKTSRISLSKRELLNSAGSQGDPLKAITALPGIVPAGENSAEVYIRGSNTRENIAWINRAPVGYLYHFGGMQSTINPALVEDINVFLGGFPVEYGNALGGVIDVKLRAPKQDRMHYRFDISTIASSFLIEGPAGKENKNSFYIAARRSYIDLLFSPTEFDDLFNDDSDDDDPDQIVLVPRYYDVQGLYRQELNQGYLDYYFFAAGDEMAMDVNSSAKSDPQFSGELFSKKEYQTAGITWWQGWNSRINHVMTLAWYHNKNSLRLGRDENGKPFYADTETSTLFWQPELRWRYTENDQIYFGLQADYTEAPVDLYISRPPDEQDADFDLTGQKKHRLDKKLYATAFAPYLKYRKQWTGRLNTTLGLRYSDISISGGFRAQDFSPRAALEYVLNPDTLLTASWGRYIQIPRGTEIVENFGNPGLKVTEAEHRILGIQHRLNALYSIKAEVYHKPMDKLVVAIDENDPPDNYTNRGTGEAYGFDLFLKREPRNRKIGWFALSWAKSRRTNELTGITREFSGDQPLTLTAVWSQPFSGSWNRWEWSIKALFHSGTPYTEITGRHHEDPTNPDSRWIAEYGKHNGKRTPSYYKVDLRIAREFLFNESKMKFYLDMQNVTFSKNIVSYDYGDEYEKIGNPDEITGMGFFPFFGIEMEL